MNKFIYSLLLLCAIAQGSFAQKQVQLKQFKMQSSSQVSENGENISQTNYQSKAHWYPAQVPTTVLNTLVKNGVYPDPYQGMNNMLIPDASDEFNKTYDLEKYSFLPNEPNPWKKPYWFRTQFDIPASDAGKQFQLIFKGINYRAEIWVNGHLIADSSQLVGMFAEWNLNISKAVKTGNKNILAVKIYPLDYPGLPDKEQLKALDTFFLNGGPTGDIGKNVTQACSVGWDWMPPVRDRNMGIWQPVYLRTTGDAKIGPVKLVTDLPQLPDTSIAKINIKTSIENLSAKSHHANLAIEISPLNFASKEIIKFSKNLTLNATSSNDLELNANEIKSLLVKNPKLWWPNGYGKANLYKMRMKLTVDNQLSDDTTFQFGIRTVGSKTTEVEGFTRRDFYVNGRKVHLNGGAWVPDFLLNRDTKRYDYELHLCRTSNINLVRIWGGGVTPEDDFWDACDRYGMMVWSDFWITGDTQGEFKGSPDWPLEGNVFIKNVRSTILRIRNHPSLLVWTGGNEGHARKELYDAMRNSVIELDGTRTFIPSSSGFAKLPEGWKGSYPDNQPAGVYSSGPYAWQTPQHYYELANGKKDWVFKDETGVPSQPPYSTLAKIIPDLNWDKNLPYPLNNTWGYHDACTSPTFFNKYLDTMQTYYGNPQSLQDFSIKMQLMNAMSYRSIFESVGNKINETGGVMLWKLNAAFPSVVWQIYDWYLMQNAGYYFMKNALEPIHIQYNYDNSSIALINRNEQHTGKLKALISLVDINSKVIFEKQIPNLNSKTIESKTIANIANEIDAVTSPQFLILKLENDKGQIISRNIYWFAKNNDFKAFQNLKKVKLDAKIVSIKDIKNAKVFTIQVKNNSPQFAFFINAKMMIDEEEILPSFWNENYFSLSPNENIQIQVEIPTEKLTGKYHLEFDGINITN